MSKNIFILVLTCSYSRLSYVKTFVIQKWNYFYGVKIESYDSSVTCHIEHSLKGFAVNNCDKSKPAHPVLLWKQYFPKESF